MNTAVLVRRISFEETADSIYTEDGAQGSFETFSPPSKLHIVTSQKTVEKEVQTDGQTQHKISRKSFFEMQLVT